MSSYNCDQMCEIYGYTFKATLTIFMVFWIVFGLWFNFCLFNIVSKFKFRFRARELKF